MRRILAAFRIYNADGREVRWEKLVKDVSKADVVFFGEQHNDPIGHWLELQLLKTLYDVRDGKVLARRRDV